MADKNFDPRFDPSFQRGFAAREQEGQAGATDTARLVDLFREDATSDATNRAPHSHGGAATSAAASNSHDFTPPPSPSLAQPPSPADVRAPQSQYVDDAGAPWEAVAGEAETVTPASLARNPWVYALWAVGAAGVAATAAALWWSNSILYGVTSVQAESYATVATIQSVAPIGFAVGAFSLVGAMLLHGLSWMRRN